jgi:hypothetical protein
MTDIRKIKMVQALTGAIILTLLMQPMALLGFAQYIWMLFLPLLLFFALGADIKKVPSMILCYICGVAWAFINGAVQGLFATFMSGPILNIIPTIIVIFLILTVHENLLANTVFGLVPALFMGMSTTFMVFMMKLKITPLHLVGFFCYGVVLAVAMVLIGMAVCSAIFGKDRAMATIVGDPAKK